MPQLISGLIGSGMEQAGMQEFDTRRVPLQRQQQLFDVLGRNLLGPQITLPEIPIPTPLQQAISGFQDVTQPLLNLGFGPESQLGTAGRLARGGGATAAGIPAGPGVPQFGREQTREELGLPSRREYFPFTPTEEEIRDIGLPKIRSTKRGRRGREQIGRLERREERIGERIERREAKGKGTRKAERRLERVQRKLGRKRTRFE